MLSKITNQEIEVQDISKDLPFISLITPFEPKMRVKTVLASGLDTAADNIQKELLEKYPEDQAMPVVKKLRNMIKDLNYNTRTKSIAIFISPLIEKVYYYNHNSKDN